MRRLVDASIPALCLIAIIPATVHILDLPESLQRSLGEFIGRIWAITLGIAMAFIITGVALRRRKPDLAFQLEWPALVYAGLISSIYGTAIILTAGLQGWTSAWFVWAIGAHCILRYAELTVARRKARSHG
jgi:hypothetical protein